MDPEPGQRHRSRRIDPTTGMVVSTVRVGGTPFVARTAFGDVWVDDFKGTTETRLPRPRLTRLPLTGSLRTRRGTAPALLPPFGPGALRPGAHGTMAACSALGGEPRRAADAAARDRAADGAAARVPHPPAAARGGARARRGDREVKERVRFCRECGNLTEEETCSICLDARRDHTTICVVEQPVDVVSLERTHAYHGLYHVLGGALSPIDGVDPGDLRIDELIRRVDANGVTEVVLATNPTMTGEATAAYLADRLRDRVTRDPPRERPARRRRPRVRRRGHARPRPLGPTRDLVTPARAARRCSRPPDRRSWHERGLPIVVYQSASRTTQPRIARRPPVPAGRPRAPNRSAGGAPGGARYAGP